MFKQQQGKKLIFNYLSIKLNFTNLLRMKDGVVTIQISK